MNHPHNQASNLSDEKARLLDLLLQKKGIRVAAAQEIKPKPPDASGVLSFAQQRLWFLHQLQPDSPSYNIPAAISLKGRLNVRALEQGLSEIIRRHEVLRTAFASVKGQPAPVVAPPQPVTIPLIDLSPLAADERDAEAARLTTDEAQRPFNLAHPTLLRATLLRLAPEHHTLLLTMHHIVSDGWSIGVIIRELTSLCETFSRDAAPALAELPIQYSDFAYWQRQWLQGETLENHLAYWKRQLDAAPATLELPADRPRPAVQTYRGAMHTFTLAEDLSASLKSLGQQEGATLFMTLLAVFKVLLARYSKQEDVVVGSPIANRSRAEIEGLVGFFVNTLVYRTDLSGNPTFRELLGRVREVALGAYAHQDLPFEKLVEELHPERNLSHTPLVQVLFVLQNAPQPELKIPGLEVSALRTDSSTAKFDLTLEMMDADGRLNGALEYNADLFEADTVARMAGHFQNLLTGIVARPDERLAALPLLTDDERHQLLVAWNETDADVPSPCIHELFEAQAARTPDAVAVVFQNHRLSYRELNRRANQLAHRLRGAGIGADAFVAVCMERSLEMVVAVLGVLKAGAAYVPLDPAYPKERLAFMLEDTRARVLLTQQHLQQRLPEHRAEKICLDADWDAIARESDADTEVAVSADNLAYITYTSGSTGKPKGIAMPQRALLNLLEWQRRYTPMPERARTLQFASLSFDVSFQDIFSTWLSGGTLVMIPEEVRQDIAGLAQVLVDEEINRLFIPAVALQQLAEGFCTRERPQSQLRRVIAGSEQLHITQFVARMFAQVEGCVLANEYGPSETHVVTALALPPTQHDWPQRPPVGRPISNTRIYILDPYWNPAPIGVSGELLIGGLGLARGYLNRPDLTGASFVPDPFGSQPGGRLYRTGDLARYLPDGNIEFLGRMDHQVKIRGFRIELGEVETVLAQHASIKECVVIALAHPSGSKQLAAYLVTQAGAPPTVSELRGFLTEKLPEYMVPSSFVFLESLPLNSNGKIDRRALPAPDDARPDLEQAFVAPRTALEEVMAGVWAHVLNIKKIGINDNFFDLGGHSLLATQLMSRIHETFQVELPLRTIFESPTIARLNERMIQEERNAGDFEKIAQILKKLEHLSDADAAAMLLAGGSSSAAGDAGEA